jgi:hypothetical protein
VVTVALDRLDRRLCHMSQQSPTRFWNVGGEGSKARLIWEWTSGKSITPPFIRLHRDGLHLFVGGGNHRLAVARAKRITDLPVLVDAEEYDQVSAVLEADF